MRIFFTYSLALLRAIFIWIEEIIVAIVLLTNFIPQYIERLEQCTKPRNM
jgi:hypothetical protein